MELSLRKEQFSNAFVHAAAAVAGFSTSKPNVDDDSIDWTISQRGGNGAIKSPKLDLQLKCTGAPDFGQDHLRFAVSIKNYEDLRAENTQVPRILVVVTVPAELNDWLELNEEVLSLRKCAYWLSLRGHPPTENVETVTVMLPRTQRFDHASLGEMMNRIGDGGVP